MVKKTLLVAAFALASLLLSDSASAQCYSGGGYGHGGHRGYGAPVVAYRGVPGHGYGHHHHHGSVYSSGYGGIGVGYGSFYGPAYGRGIGYGYGAPYYGGGNAFGVGPGGFSLRIGF